MSNQIEIFDQKRRKYLRGFLFGLVIFFLTWILRFILRAYEIGSTPVHMAILGLLILCILVQAYFAINLTITVSKIKKDPQLYSALYNELVRLHELKAWRVAFFSALGSVILIAVLSFFMPVRDIVFIALTAILAGSGGYHSAFYYLDRK
jgi:Na+-driven multidrug efflux pump